MDNKKNESTKTGITLATKITIIRLALLPLILFFYVSSDILEGDFFYKYGKLIALIIFVVASVTDFLDGWIARRFNQVSDLGKLLDPIADKLLTTLGLILVVTDISIVGAWALLPLWFAVVIIFCALARDFIVSFVRQIAADKGIVYAANWSGKIKTTVQLIGIIMLMFYAFSFAQSPVVLKDTILDIYECAVIVIMAAVVVLNAYSTYDYIVKYKIKLAEKRKSN